MSMGTVLTEAGQRALAAGLELPFERRGNEVFLKSDSINIRLIPGGLRVEFCWRGTVMSALEMNRLVTPDDIVSVSGIEVRQKITLGGT